MQSAVALEILNPQFTIRYMEYGPNVEGNSDETCDDCLKTQEQSTMTDDEQILEIKEEVMEEVKKEPPSENDQKDQNDQKDKNKILPQIKATCLANLAMLACGISYGWVTPSLPKLENKSSDLYLTSDEGAWVTTALPLGAIVGPFLAAALIDHIGRKWYLYLTSIPFIICWVLTFLATSWIELFVGRLIAGLSLGSLFAVVPVYLGEIVETKIRGAVNAIMPAFINMGYIIMYAAGPVLDRKMLAIVCLAPTIIFMLTFIWMPESPYYYLKKKNQKQAELALIWLRSSRDTHKELDEMSEFIKMEENASLKELFVNRTNRKALLILLLLLTGQQFSGILAVSSYASFLLSNVTMSSNATGFNYTLIIIGAMCFVANIVSTFIIDRIGRRYLYLGTAYTVSLTLVVVAIYFHLQKLNFDVVKFSWVPLVAIIVYFIANFLGLVTVPSAVSSEIFPISVKSWATTIANSYGAILAVIVAKCYQLVGDAWGSYVVFYGFAVIELVISLLATFYMPETAGKSFIEIQNMLK